MADTFKVKEMRRLRSEPVNTPETGIANLPVGCIVTKLEEVASNSAWWKVSTKKRDDTTLTGFIEHAALEPEPSPPAEFPPAQPIVNATEGPPPASDGGPPPASDRWSVALANASTRGASNKTAASDRIPTDGIEASRQMAQTDWGRVQALIENFREAGKKFDVPPAILAAIASRESRCGNALRADGAGGDGHAWGIMQIDARSHPELRGKPDWKSRAHIEQATEILIDNLKRVQDKHADWEDKDVLRGAVAAYNFGVSNVRTIEHLDDRTTNNDYSADVIARAQFYSALI